MKKISTDWSLKSVIGNCETATFEQKQISSRYQESLLTFDDGDVVNGTIHTFITPGMEVSRMNIQSQKNIVATQEDGPERYVSTFVSKGSIHSSFVDANATLEQNKQQHSFVHSRTNESRHTIAAGNTSIMYINLRPEFLKAFVPDWDQYADRWYKKNNYEKFYASGAFQIGQNSRMQQILLSIYGGDTFSSATSSLHMEAKAMELMALQMEEVLLKAEKPASQAFDISKTDHEKLVAMHEYINGNYLQPLSLSGLAKRFTLNEFKLKKGFRQLYRQSAFNYIHTLRMQHAKEMLQSGDMTVNEVSDMTGYSSIHNFSNAFYKMYNYRPSMVRRSNAFV